MPMCLQAHTHFLKQTHMQTYVGILIHISVYTDLMWTYLQMHAYTQVRN